MALERIRGLPTMGTITIGYRSFETPVLVPSVSSFETQLQPIDALLLQYTLQEPISLVSAYDVWLNRKGMIPVCKQFRRQAVLLLYSVGLQILRIGHYSPDRHSKRWYFYNFSKNVVHV